MASAKKKSNANATSANRDKRDAESKFVVCVANNGYPPSLELHKIYKVVTDDEATAQGDIRVIDESGEDYLYSADRFVEVDLPQTVRRSLLHAA